MARTKQRRISQTPRKQASQSRSRQTVANILESCELLIRENGLEKLTTNRIAERAGVNIASLYQYFPNKEAVVDTLLARLFEQESQAIGETISQLTHHPSIRDAAKQVIHLAIRLFRSSEHLLINVMNYHGDYNYLKQAEGFTNHFTVAGKTFLQKRHRELRVKNLDHALYLLSNSIIPLLINYLSRSPANINDEEFVEEVSDLLCCYLLK